MLWASSGSLLVVLVMVNVASVDNIEDKIHICNHKGLYSVL